MRAFDSDCHSFTVQAEMLTGAHINDKYSLALSRRTNKQRHIWYVLLLVIVCTAQHQLEYEQKKANNNIKTERNNKHTTLMKRSTQQRHWRLVLTVASIGDNHIMLAMVCDMRYHRFDSRWYLCTQWHLKRFDSSRSYGACRCLHWFLYNVQGVRKMAFDLAFRYLK